MFMPETRKKNIQSNSIIPKVSVITVSLDSEKYIESAIQSVLHQTFANVEYLIVDGGSTDGTLDIIRKYEQHIHRWISEPDAGIADAMNKGLSMATGEYVIFLHSDDYFIDKNSLSRASEYLHSGAEIFLFNIYLEKDGSRTLRRPRGFNWWMNLKTGIFHQSTICKRSLFDTIGSFDTSLKIAMDYDFFLRAYRSGIMAEKIDIAISVMRLVGISSQLNWSALEKRFHEERTVHLKNCNGIFMLILYKIFWYVYPKYRKISNILCS